jgi:putative CocE/NonD family hydrolase
MKRRVFYLLFILIPFIPFSPTEANWVHSNYTKVEKYITMRDGTKLFTRIFIPKNANEKHPILLSRTPYSCAPYGAGKFHKDQWPYYWRNYMRENYIVVTQDVRGKWMSEGEFVDVRPYIRDKKSAHDVDESSDAYDTIDWLVKNIPANNGKVGVVGSSYPGLYAAMAAVDRHPAVKAVSPQAPVTDWFIGDDFHHNGAFFLMDAFDFFSSFGKARPRPTTMSSGGYSFPDQRLYDFYLNAGTLAKISGLLGDSIRFWKEMFLHPDYDAWWQARDSRRSMNDINIPILVVGGLFDAEDCFGAWNLYKAIEKQNPLSNNKIVMGPWAHDQWKSKEATSLGDIDFGSNTSAWFQQNIEIPFFNHYLKDNKPSPAIAEATVFFSGDNQWRRFEKWPPLKVETSLIYLHEKKSLSWRVPNEKQSFSEYTSDPSNPVPWMDGDIKQPVKVYMTADQRFAAVRKDVLIFETDILDQDIVLAGPVVADLKVSINTTDADFVVKLIDIFPGTHEKNEPGQKSGYQMLIRGEIMRGRYRNSFEHPVAFMPGQIETVKFELPDVAHVFKKGHRLAIQVQSSWFPLADRNPQKFINIYQARDADFQKAQIRIYHDATNSSNILLPILKK